MGLRTDKLIDREEIKEELVKIKESDRDYITPTGKIYSLYPNGKYYPKTSFINKHNGYVYINIHRSDGKCVSRRLHRLLAKAYIPNPDNLPCVMHINNDKSDYRLENLKWGTESENTQQAVDDGLLVNAKSFEDSQSMPVNLYDLFTMELIQEFGSISEAERILNIEKSSIINSCNYKYKNVRKPYYFRYASEGNVDIPNCVGMYDAKTDILINKFINGADASKKTGIPLKTICDQILKNRKPKRIFDNTQAYFLKIER